MELRCTTAGTFEVLPGRFTLNILFSWFEAALFFISISFCISTVEVLAGDTELLLPALAPTRLRSKLGIFGAGFVVLVLVLESSVASASREVWIGVGLCIWPGWLILIVATAACWGLVISTRNYCSFTSEGPYVEFCCQLSMLAPAIEDAWKVKSLRLLNFACSTIFSFAFCYVLRRFYSVVSRAGSLLFLAALCWICL